MLDRNTLVNLEDSIVAIGPNSQIHKDFLPLLWQHDPRAVLLCPGFKPDALMVRQVQKVANGWRFPSPPVPIPPGLFANLSFWGPLPLRPLIRMVNQSEVCLSFEFDDIEEKLLMAPYRHEYGLDPGSAICLQGDYVDCQWLEYQRFLQEHPSALKDGDKCVMSFEEYVEYLKTPEERLLELCGFGME